LAGTDDAQRVAGKLMTRQGRDARRSGLRATSVLRSLLGSARTGEKQFYG